MLIRTSADLGAIIRERRKQLKLDQAKLAKRIGVSRQWLVGVEQGHPRAALGLVLRALDTLGIRLTSGTERPEQKGATGPDIDAIVAAARKGNR